MKTKSQIKQGETTNVRSSSVIDFAPLDTVSREDDKEQWATPQFYCESDKEESEYVPPKSANLRKALTCEKQKLRSGKRNFDGL